MAAHRRHGGPAGLAWIGALPGLVERFLAEWELRRDGPVAHGMVSLVLPVRRADGTAAVLKLQPVTDENVGEPVGLRAWAGDGAVRLLEHDPGTLTMLLERLDAARPLSTVFDEPPFDEQAAVRVIAELLARLVAVPAPAGLRRLADIAAGMLDRAPAALPALADPAHRKLLHTCASVVAELMGATGNAASGNAASGNAASGNAASGNALLHWDLHYDNVLAGQREPWLAIDPKPLAGDPGFELMPALRNRWAEAAATGDPHGAVLRRFDLMTEVLGLDRSRAAGWTLGRVLQNTLWDIADGGQADPAQIVIAEAVLRRR